MRLVFLAAITLILSQPSLHAQFNKNQLDSEEIQVYIDPENIQLTGNEIQLCIGDGRAIPLQNIHSNGRGIFTTLNRESEHRYTTYICPGCGKIYYWWQNCDSPGCPKNTRKN